MIDLLLFTLLGIGLGIMTGLLPGLHVNTVSLVLLGLSFINPYYVVVIIISLAITHTIFDFIPSIFLGAPDPSTALSVLPGHQYLLEGKGIQAVYLTLTGGVTAILLTAITFPLSLILIPVLYQNIQNYIHWILIGISLVMILSERGTQKLHAAIIFFMSGLLGIILLNPYILPSEVVLFPIFTGLFGMSNLLLSLHKRVEIPKQVVKTFRIARKTLFSGSIKGLFSGALLGVLPGVGAAEATALTQQITRKKSNEEFLISIGAINTIVALFSLISLYTISRPRSGAAVAVQRLITNFGFTELLLLLAVTLLATGISSFIMLKSFKPIIRVMQSIDYLKLTKATIIFLIVLTFIFAGPFGLLILAVSTSIGLLAPLYNVRRSILMGVLMLPLILFYAGI